jgi:hypothetical protein
MHWGCSPRPLFAGLIQRRWTPLLGIRQQFNGLLNALQTYCMMLPLNLHPQLYATSALWTNDSTMENIMLAYSEIWLIKYKKERRGKRWDWVFWSVCVRVQFLSAGKRGVCHELELLMITITHTLQYPGLELDRQETSATEVCESSPSFYMLVPPWLFLYPFYSKFLAHCWRIGRRAPLLNGVLKFAWLIERGTPTCKGHAHLRRGCSSLPYW